MFDLFVGCVCVCVYLFVCLCVGAKVVQHLSNLGVKNFAADSKEVNAAYRGKAMNLHPDR